MSFLQAQATLAKSLKSATDEIVLQELLCAAFPELKEARDEYRQQARAAWILNDFFQYVRELAEPPMLPRSGGEEAVILEQMGFTRTNTTMYCHPVYDFFVHLVPSIGYDERWNVDATRTSWRHFFRRFYARIEQRVYEGFEKGLE